MIINEVIKNLNISDEEKALLLLIIQKKGISIYELSKSTNVPRSSIYRYVEKLESLGYIRKKMKKQGFGLEIANLESAKADLSEKKKSLEDQILQIDQLNQLLLNLKDESSVLPGVTYFEGKEGVRNLIWNTLKSKKEIKCLTNAVRREIVGGEWIDRYCEEFCLRKLTEKVLGDKEYAKNSYQKFGGRERYFGNVPEYYKRSDERVMSNKFLKIQGETYIYNDTLSFYTWEGKTLVGVEIISKYLSSTFGSIFDLLRSMTSEKDSIDLM